MLRTPTTLTFYLLVASIAHNHQIHLPTTMTAAATTAQVSMERCSEDDLRVCDLAIAPRTLTAVAFPPDVTCLLVEHCVLTVSDSDNGDSGGGSEGDEAEEGLWECLTDPLPKEYYGTTVYYDDGGGTAGSSEQASSQSSISHWPSSVEADYSVAPMCEQVQNYSSSSILFMLLTCVL